MAPKPAEKAPSSQAQNPAAYGYTRKGLSGQDATNSSASAATPGGKASTSTNFKDSAGQGSQNAPGRLITDRSDGRSLREKFNVDTRTGGVSFSVPIQTSPGRSGFGPSLSLAYDSGSASSNGVFGLGWHLSGVDSIARKTSVMIPVYDNDQDTFVHSRVGDLVPVMQPGSDEPVEWDEKLGTSNYRVRIYRPRVESDPVRVERWSSLDSSGKMHWKTVESGNKTTIFGQDTGSQISSNHGTAGEGGLELVFSWLVNEVYDSQGNHMVFSYKTESQPALTASIADKVYENNRNATSQRYLKRIKYGNKKPNRDLKDWGVLNASPQDDQWYWMFEVVFDYGEHPGEYPTTQEDPTGWALRPDPFSVHTSGFEIRTYRLCQRVLMFHHFEELKRQDYLIAAAEFKYETDAKSGESVLRSCIQCGYQLNGENLSCVRLPASEFEYWTSPDVGDISVEEFELDLSGLSTPGVQWVDLHGDGAPGVLARVPGRGWYYHGNESGDTPAFGAATLVSQIPSVVDSDDWSFEDLTGNGKLDVAYANPEGHVWGFYERQDDGEWSSFAPFESYPTAYFNSDPAFHKVDLNGDGHADILQLLPQQNDEFGWYPSLGRKGYSAGKRTSGAPPLPLGEGKLLILCDMDGDGLSDIVLIYNSHICYWPNMGHGRFGQKVIMANPPFLADNTSFSPLRIRMADITGSGTADLIYLPPEGGVLVYYNQSGNVWSDAHVLPTFPPLDQLCAVDLFDIGGRGTQCLCWTSDHLSRSTGSTTVRYIDLMGGRKPGLMTKCSNGVGGEVEMTYRSSTHYHQEDKRAGRPWATKLPFPIHCVEQVVTKDVVAQTACTTRYFYHDGYYDHVERQFRGFQMVETWDAEDFSSVSTKKFHRPPVHTKTWFYLGLQRIDEATVLPGCYQINQPQQSPLPSAKIHAKVSAQQLAVEDIKDAFRALAGQQRRQEVFSDDGSLKSVVPYLVSQQTFEVVMHQAVLQGQRYGIFRVNRREELTSHYERELDEATVQHSFILQTDDYGNVCSQVAINYGKPDSKLEKDEDRQKQQEAIIFYTETDHTNAFDPLASPDSTQVGYFQAPLPSEVRQYRVFPGSSWICNSPARYDWETLAASISEIKEVSIHGDPPTGSSERGYSILLSKTRTLYSKTDLTGPLPANKLEQFSIEYQSYRLALTKELLETTLKDGEAPLLDSKALSKELSEGGYMQLDNRTDEWWAPFTRKLFKDDISDDNPYSSLAAARSYFYLSNAEIDQFNNVSHQELDKYRLLTEKSIDAVKNETLFENDYVHLQATLITDANGNRTQTVFDPCGRPVGAAVMGKTTEALGDSLDGFSVELSQDQLDQFIENPSGPIAAQLLGNAGRRAIYHDRFGRDTNQKPEKIIPAFHAELVRDTHYKDDSGKAVSSQIAVHIIYLDGHGEAIQEVSLSGNSGDANAWQFSGWVIRDNKRQPVQEFHPFKALTHDFHSQVDSSSVPATTLLRDPLDRVVAVLNANHTWSKIRFTPWIQVAYDAGDTVKTDNPATDKDVGSYFAMLDQDSYFPTWYNNEKTPREVASKSEAYNDTPTTTHMDSLGREIVIEVDNGPLGQSRDIRVTRTEYDIRGNVTELRDALDRVVTVTHYDLLGQPLHSVNMDSGSRWHLVDCCGSPILTWSGRGDQHRTLYDQLRRVQSVKIRRPSDSSELTVVKNIYGEGQPDALKNNLRGQLYECYDQSGRQTNDHFDFHGNCIESSVQYAIDYKNVLDWSKESTKLEKDTEYKTQSSFNAIGHLMHTEDFSNESVWRTYDIAGRLKTLESRAADGDTITSSVLNVEYSEDNKITLIEYGNGSRTSHEYDPITRRLVKTTTKCTKDSATLEALSLTYDCMGRIVHKADEAQQTVYFDNSVVSPSQEFRYDAIGQLLEATGREQVDITNGGQKRMRVYDATSGQRNPVPGDGRQMIEYIETYEYDVAGNIQKMKHEPRTATEYSGWTRAYSYDEPSCISSDARVKSNRLSSTAVRKVMETYQYNDDAGRNGCMTSIPGYSLLNWDHNDKLRAFSTQRVAEGSTPETTWYVYNAEGTRVRKVTERASINGTTPTRSKETRYLPMRDIYTTYGGDGFSASCQITTASVGDASLAERPIALLEHDASTKEQLIRYQTSMNLELDNNAQVLSYNEYSPFGASTYQALTKGVPRKYRFMGYQHDTESGLYICGERYYAPWLGRWTSPDPLGTDDGLNLYAYVKNDPVNFEDQQGTMRTEAENAALLEQRRAVRAPDTTHVTVPLNQIRWTQDSIGAEMGLPNIGPRQTHVAVEANTLAAQVASLQDTGLPLRAAQEQIAEEFLNGFGRIKVGLAAGQDQGGGPEQFAWYSVDNRRLTVLKTAMPDSDVPIRAEIADTAELNRATGTSVGQRQSEGFSELIDEGWRMRNSARVDDPDRVGVINKRIKKMWKDEGYFRFSKWTTVNDGSGIELRPPVIDGWEGGGRGGFRGGRGGGRGARGGRGGRGRGGGGRGGGRGGFNGGGRGGFNGGARGGFNGGGQGWPGGQGGFNRGRGGF